MNPELTLTLAELQAKAKLCAQLSLGVVPDIADIEAVRSLQDELDDTVRSAVQRGLVPADPEAAVLEWWRELVAWADHVLSFVADNQRVADEIQSVADRLHTRGSAPGTHLPTQVSQRQIEDWAADLSAARTTARARLDSFRGQIIDSHWHGDSPSPGLMFVAQAAATRSFGSPGAVAKQTERCVRARRVVCGHEPREAGHSERTELDAALDQAHAAIEALKAGQLTHGRQLQAVDEKARAGDVEAAIRDLERLPRLFADCDYDGAAAVLNALREVEVLCTAESVGGVPSEALDLGELRCRVTAATAHWPADTRAALIQRLDRAGATIQARSERRKAWRAIRDLTVTIAAGVLAALVLAVMLLSALPKHPMVNTNAVRSALAEPPTVNTNAVDMLSPEQAKALATGEGWLPLNGLTMLSDEAAKALAQHKGGLSLTGLTTLSDGAAKALAQHRGMLYLDGLTTLSDEAAKALRANPGVVMPNKFRR